MNALPEYTVSCHLSLTKDDYYIFTGMLQLYPQDVRDIVIADDIPLHENVPLLSIDHLVRLPYSDKLFSAKVAPVAPITPALERCTLKASNTGNLIGFYDIEENKEEIFKGMPSEGVGRLFYADYYIRPDGLVGKLSPALFTLKFTRKNLVHVDRIVSLIKNGGLSVSNLSAAGFGVMVSLTDDIISDFIEDYGWSNISKYKAYRGKKELGWVTRKLTQDEFNKLSPIMSLEVGTAEAVANAIDITTNLQEVLGILYPGKDALIAQGIKNLKTALSNNGPIGMIPRCYSYVDPYIALITSITWHERYHHHVELDRWDGNYTIPSAIKAGVPMEVILPYMTSYVCDLFKAYVIDNKAPPYPNLVTKNTYDTLLFKKFIYDVVLKNLPKEVCSSYLHIHNDLCNMELFDEVGELLGMGNSQLVQLQLKTTALFMELLVRTAGRLEHDEPVKLEAGFTVRLHRHELIKWITLADLKHIYVKAKDRISYKKFYKIARARMLESIEKTALEDVPLPIFPYDLESDKVRQIKSSFELVMEGKNMNHCVGSYVDTCLSNEYYVYHVDDDTEYGYTVGIMFDRTRFNACDYRVDQMYGHSNTTEDHHQELWEQLTRFTERTKDNNNIMAYAAPDLQLNTQLS